MKKKLLKIIENELDSSLKEDEKKEFVSTVDTLQLVGRILFIPR